MPDESKGELILATFLTKLAGITAGATIHYTVDKAARVHQFDEKDLKTEVSDTALLRSDPETVDSMTTGGRDVLMHVAVLRAQLITKSQTDPFEDQDPIVEKIARRMIRDLEVILDADRNFGCQIIFFMMTDRAFYRTAKHTIGILELDMLYNHTYGEP